MQVISHVSLTRKRAALSILAFGAALALMLIVTLLPISAMTREAYSVPLTAVSLGAFVVLCLVAVPGIRSWGSGALGEWQVLGLLKSLSDDYVAVTNIVVPGTEQGDIDLILIGPMGVLVIEIKSYEGVIVYADGRWGKRRSPTFVQWLKSNPSRQAKRNARAVSMLLDGGRTRRCASDALPIVPVVPVVPVVVFVGADRLEIEGLDLAAMSRRDLAQYAKSLPALLTPDQVEAIAKLFQISVDPTTEAEALQTSRAEATMGMIGALDVEAGNNLPSEAELLPSPPHCPRCAVPMVLRTARRGGRAGEQFYGCVNYPKCRQIIQHTG